MVAVQLHFLVQDVAPTQGPAGFRHRLMAAPGFFAAATMARQLTRRGHLARPLIASEGQWVGALMANLVEATPAFVLPEIPGCEEASVESVLGLYNTPVRS